MTSTIRSRAGYVGERLLPFDRLTVGADFITLFLCCLAYGTGRFGVGASALGALSFISLALHGLMLLLHYVVAG